MRWMNRRTGKGVLGAAVLDLALKSIIGWNFT